MYTCNITIKIKDYNPKIETIPYQNYTCVFTCEDVEFQMPLIAQESDICQHQIKNITSDLKYKIHILDHNDMTLIGMCDLLISYDILSQLSPPNGFVQEQTKKVFMDPKTKRKLFGSIMNVGDIYLDIYCEIYLCKKVNVTKKKEIKKIKIQKNLKKADASPKMLQKKQLMMDLNSEKQAILNRLNNTALTRNNNILGGGKSKKDGSARTEEVISKVSNNIISNFQPNSSLNYKENNHVNKSKKKPNMINDNINKSTLNKKNTNPNFSSKKKTENNESKNSNILIHEFNTNNYTLNNVANKINDGINPVKKNKTIIPMPKKEKKTKVNNLSNINNSKELSNNIQFNNNPLINGKKITTIESLENIEHSGKKYITKKTNNRVPEPLHLKNSNSNNTNNNYNSVFTTNSTDQNFNEMDKIILEKGTEIRNIFQNQISEDDMSNNFNGIIKENINQEIIKNNLIKLIDFYSLLNEKLIKVNTKRNEIKNKSIIYKEKLFGELKKNNVLTQKKAKSEIETFLHINNYGNLNENFLRTMIKIKKSEFKIYQNIFNFFYYEYDIMKFKESEQNKLYNNQEKTNILIGLFKNLLKTYGNISQIYISNNNKKQNLKNVLEKYNIIEKNEGGESIVQLKENENKNNNIQSNKMDKFRVIKEEDEDDFEEEDNNHISKSKRRDSKGNSNEKVCTNIIGLNQHKKIDYRENFQEKNIENNKEIEDKLNSNKMLENNNNINENKNEQVNDYKIETENENIENNEKKENEINDMSNDINEENIERKIIWNNYENEINNDDNDDNVNIGENENKNEEFNNDEEIENNQKRPIRNRKNRIIENEENQNDEKENYQIENINNEKKNSEEKNLKKEKPEKEEDEEDLIMQKLLIEEFPKKCQEENQFVRINKYEYLFGDEKINVMYSNGEVILKLDEGDYTLDEFIEILNEGKENEQRQNEINEEEENVEEKENNEEENYEIENIEQNNIEENIEQEQKEIESDEQENIEQKNKRKFEEEEQENEKQELITPIKSNEGGSSNKDGNSESVEEKMTWRKRRRHKISDESSGNKDENENNQEIEKPTKEYKISSSNKKYYYSNKKSSEEENKEINDEKENNSNKKEEKKEEDEEEGQNSEAKYKIRRRRDYMNVRK